tara:strand:+ start:977 stop:2035 length:1059 start_codon:yes stop_codon:yes gene_type:complete
MSRQQIYLFRREAKSGGAEVAANRLAKQFKNLSFDVIKVRAGDIIGGHRIGGRTGPGWLRLIRYAISSNRLIQSLDAGVLSFSLERGVKADIYRAGEGVHLAWLSRKGVFRSLLSFRILHPVAMVLEAMTLKSARKIVANSFLIASELAEYYPQYAGKVEVIENGFDPKKFFVDSAVGDDDVKMLCFAGNGWERKGLVEALKLLAQLPQDWRLSVLGKGDAGRYSQIAKEIGVADRVEFFGEVSEPEKWFRKAHVFILPTLYDPFSNACLEAMACGCAVITTSNNGFSSLVEQGVNGYLLDQPFSKSVSDWCEERSPSDRIEIADSIKGFTILDESDKYAEVFREFGKTRNQ